MSATLRIAVIYPDLLGTYGDGGNGLILARRAEWRGIDVDLLPASSEGALPEADLYCLGGGEDGPQVRAAQSLIDDGTLVRRVKAGAVVLAVCAGYQIVGTTFPAADGTPHDGVALLGLTTTKGTGTRSVGEVTADITQEATDQSPALATLPTLTGFENHGGVTALAEGTVPLARVTGGIGVGNGDGSGTEGAVAGRVVGTYLHGPVLARNPVLADVLLAWALDIDPDALMPLDDSSHESLRAERLGPLAPAGKHRRRRSRATQS
jgi:lipid II isoglutaminyl synthase (glutamine-hydrolysing)